MGAQLIDGNAVAQAARARLAERAAALVRQRVTPALAVVLVGDNAASKVYVRNKILACQKAGVRSLRHDFPADVAPDAVIERIRLLNADPAMHGILMQLPLPPQFDIGTVIATIAPEKDVDGLHMHNLGALVAGAAPFPPCTPQGVMALLDSAGVPIAGRHAVVVGRSNIVGKPMALMLLHRDATVTICTSHTKPLADYTRQADLLIVAAGRPQLVRADMVKPGAAVIDVGIHRTAEGKLIGDVDFEGVSEVAGYITPVPGGVGPMTVTMLLANTLRAAERAAQARRRNEPRTSRNTADVRSR